MTIDQTVGIIAHLPLNAILKGSCGVKFELVAVKLAKGIATSHPMCRILDSFASCMTYVVTDQRITRTRFESFRR